MSKSCPANAGIPKEIICSECGIPKKINPKQFRKQLEKHGFTQEEFVKQYICRTCKSSHKVSKTSTTSIALASQRFRSTAPAGTKLCKVPKFIPKVPVPNIGSTKVCWHQTIYFNNGKYCDGCRRWEICEVGAKRLKDEVAHARNRQKHNVETAT